MLFANIGIHMIFSMINVDLVSLKLCLHCISGNIFENSTNSSYDMYNMSSHIGRDHAYQLRDAMAMYENNTLWPNMPKVGFPTLTLSNVCFNDSEAMLEPLDSESTTLDESILYDIGEHIDNNDRCITERLSMVRYKHYFLQTSSLLSWY